MSKFVFPLDKVSAPDTELLELGFPLYCRPENQFQHANNIQHPSERGRTCRDGSYKYLCVCLWLKCWLRTFALTYSYNCISWSGSGHEITPPSHDTDAGALLQASYKSFSLQVTRTTVQVSSIQIVGIQTDWKRQKLWILQIRGRVVEQHASPDHDMSLWVRGRERHCRFCAAATVRSGLHWLHFS